ncbi:MAG: Unknown protein [uncultured Sulfurovum sp.]|uniref:Uncharacterized protein n=1 Tax=uncultured Sulfurovum sp. TaxID=269237 RepID=A0A6S6TPN5_9BACT|nr:MAG: Unknown protein [uncultured Sulfurovum sp.]
MSDLEIIKELEDKGIKLTSHTLENDKVIELRIIGKNINDSLFKIILRLSNLKYLELRSTDNITEIPNEISNLSKLEYFNLDNNKIGKISDEISKLTSLKTLDLSRNNLTSIPNGIAKIINLEKLDLSSNKITSIPSHISKLINLNELDLDNNELNVISKNLFQLNNLKTLDLRENLIEKIPNKISELTQLEELYLSSNEIEELSNGIFELKNLKELDLGNNKIAKLPKKIGNLTPDFKISIKRFFYPIGHGAFYAEKHQYRNSNFTIVYDCGSRSSKDTVQPIIEKAFEQDEVIDILFISHFDADHVNKIKLLKNRTKIKQVVMPLLQEKEIVFLINLYRVLNVNILGLLKNPEQFFGKETKIIRIKPSNNEERPIENMEAINIENISHNSEIDSGIPLKLSNDLDWVFIPYNHEYTDRQKELVELLKERTDLDIDKLKTDVDYTLAVIFEDYKKTVKIKNKIKNIYNEVDGKINQNSMLLYSGVLNFPNTHLIKRSYLVDFEDIRIRDIEQVGNYTNRVSCLYTGDTELGDIELKKVNPKLQFSRLWDSIGTIQIPHHGSVKNLDKAILDNNVYMCPMSVSTKSLGYHPSKSVIDDIYAQNSHPILVTKQLNSGFVECIGLSYSLGMYKKYNFLEKCNRRWR